MRHRPDIEDDTGQGGHAHRSHRLAKVALLGGAVVLLTRSGLRGRVLDALFGPEEQFEYESETEPEPLSDLAAEPVEGGEEPAEPVEGGEEPDEAVADAEEPAPGEPESRVGDEQPGAPTDPRRPLRGDEPEPPANAEPSDESPDAPFTPAWSAPPSEPADAPFTPAWSAPPPEPVEDPADEPFTPAWSVEPAVSADAPAPPSEPADAPFTPAWSAPPTEPAPEPAWSAQPSAPDVWPVDEPLTPAWSVEPSASADAHPVTDLTDPTAVEPRSSLWAAEPVSEPSAAAPPLPAPVDAEPPAAEDPEPSVPERRDWSPAFTPAPAADADADDVQWAPGFEPGSPAEAPSVHVDPPAPGGDAPSSESADGRYSWGGDRQRDEESPPMTSEARDGAATVTDLRPVESPALDGDDLTSYDASGVVFAPDGDAASREAPQSRDLTEPPSSGPLWESPVRPMGTGAPEGSVAAAVASEPAAPREADPEPWRTEPSIVIENGGVVLDRTRSVGEPRTPWAAAESPDAGAPLPEPAAEPAPPVADPPSASLMNGAAPTAHTAADRPAPPSASLTNGASATTPRAADPPSALANRGVSAAEGPVATAEPEPAGGEAAPRRSRWSLSRRRRPAPEPPRWD